MKVVSFYCDIDENKFYENNAIRLKKRCEELGVDHYIVEESFGDEWIDNVKAKPAFLLKTLNFLNEDFAWLDVDCDISKKIDFKFDCDWMIDFRPDGKPHDYVHLVRNTEKNRDFLNKWVAEVERIQRGSHSAFINIYKNLNFQKMPEGYVSLGLSDVESKKKYFKEDAESKSRIFRKA